MFVIHPVTMISQPVSATWREACRGGIVNLWQLRRWGTRTILLATHYFTGSSNRIRAACSACGTFKLKQCKLRSLNQVLIAVVALGGNCGYSIHPGKSSVINIVLRVLSVRDIWSLAYNSTKSLDFMIVFRDNNLVTSFDFLKNSNMLWYVRTPKRLLV